MVASKVQECVKGGYLKRCFMSVSKVIDGCVKDVSRMSLGYLMGVSMVFQFEYGVFHGCDKGF